MAARYRDADPDERRLRLVAGVAALIIGGVALSLGRTPGTMDRGIATVIIYLVFFAGILLGLVVRALGRGRKKNWMNFWFTWGLLNVAWLLDGNWGFARTEGRVAAGACMLLAVVGFILEQRRPDAAEPRVAADRAAPGR